MPRFLFSALALMAALAILPASQAQKVAATPPMGWNSWDSYGFTIDEAEFKANAAVLASFKQYGWQYAVIDEGWYMQNPLGANLEARKYLLNANGILIPVEARFPSSANGAGFKPLADWIHAQGLKFGIHIVRGIPRQAVKDNLPIGGSSFHAAEAADTSDACPWDEGNWGIKDNAAGQAYYDSLLKLYAGWGLDYIKVDCISDHPYKPAEIRQIAEAIKKTGRPIVLSLSPGPTQLKYAAEVGKYAQMWRIADDHWDGWTFPHKPADGEYPFGLRDEFDRLAEWAQYAKPGNWPDADMLPESYLGPHPGNGEARQSHYTQDEQRTEFTLWAIARSPLIFGGNLTKLDDFSRSLMTNRNILGINQLILGHSHPLQTKELPAGFEDVRVWQHEAPGFGKPSENFAFFNLDDKPVTLHFNWTQFGLTGKHKARSIWGSKNNWSVPAEDFDIVLTAHGSEVYSID